MKRKLLILALVAAMACSLAACSLTEAESLSFVSQPQSVFVVGDKVDINSLVEVNAVLTNGAVRNDVPVKITNFSTEKAGVYTATVTYRGVSISFTYYVMNSLDDNFIAGTGTAEDPYLIANADQLANIGKFTDKYTYFKVADGIQEIDCTGYATTAVNGAFDGNGVAFTNLAVTLFTAEGFKKVELQNFSVKNCEIIGKQMHAGVVLSDSAMDTTLRNINVSGSLQAQIPASFIAYGPGVGEWRLTMENCTSDATLISTSGGAAGFVAHMYSFEGTSWHLTDCYYTGTMFTPTTNNGEKDEGSYHYLTVNDTGTGTLFLKYSKEWPEELTADNLQKVSTFSNKTEEEGFTKYTEANGAYVKSLSDKTFALSSKTTEMTGEDYGTVFTVTAEENVVKAIVFFVIGPNDEEGTGNYTGIYMTENLTPENGIFTTQNITYRQVTVNGTATAATGVSEDGNTTYGETYNSCYVQIVQYDKYDNILKITNFDWSND